MKKISLYFTLLYLLFCKVTNGQSSAISWNEKVIISNVAVAEKIPGYGSQYARLLQIGKKSWLAAYTVSDTIKDASGRFRLHLEIARSDNRGRSWKPFSKISSYGRDVDNAQLIECKNGDILLSCRSTRFGESYWLPVYNSRDKGITWHQLSIIDANEGKTGSLFNPDKGIYEPHFYILDDGRLSVMYANEKHVTESIPYSQIISQKISPDFGKTWGKEKWVVYDSLHTSSRPGMPVWTQMKNGKYILVYEICGPQNCNIYYKISNDGINWSDGLGASIPNQMAAPFILSLTDGRLIVASNNGNISISEDYGTNWHLTKRPWVHKTDFEMHWNQTLWPALYQTRKNEIGVVTSILRNKGGHNVQLRFGKINKVK